KKLGRYYWRGEGTIKGPPGLATHLIECWIELPGRMRSVERLRPEKGEEIKCVSVYDRDRGWESTTGGTRALPERDVVFQRDLALYASLLPLLEDPGLTVVTVPDVRIGGQTAAGVRVSGKGRMTAVLYFDKETRLHAKLEAVYLADGKEE